ncbi:XdhC family protein [Streptomyces populi]|uniref:XdhC family protein n=1 Tax=Streptomyces populi TaxID=2058924 RepID=UPI0035D564E1
MAVRPRPDPPAEGPPPGTPGSAPRDRPPPGSPGSAAQDGPPPGSTDPDREVPGPPSGSPGPAGSTPGSPGPAGPDGAASEAVGPDRVTPGPPCAADPDHVVSGPPGAVTGPAGPHRAVTGPAGPDRGVSGSLGDVGLDGAVTADVRSGSAQGVTGLRHYGPDGERCGDDVTVFLHSFAPPPRMLVFGAIDHAAAVARVGGFLGYRVTVCDARPAFATPRRFPAGVEVVVDWPHRYLGGQATDERTVICVLTHDPKFDVPLLEEALCRPAAYIGAMGSRRTHDDRLERLRAAGVPERALSRLRSPIGLDLGARTPEEVAVSVAAEIVALRRGGSGVPLTERDGAVHPR